MLHTRCAAAPVCLQHEWLNMPTEPDTSSVDSRMPYSNALSRSPGGASSNSPDSDQSGPPPPACQHELEPHQLALTSHQLPSCLQPQHLPMLATAALALSSSIVQNTVAAGAAAADRSAVLQPDGLAAPSGVDAFLQACTTRGAATALATLAHADLLPCSADAAADGSPHSALVLTLAHMFALGTRGQVLHALNDTAVRTLLWLTESLLSQYRTSARHAALDYCCFLSGCALDSVLEVEVPAMVQLQLQVLTAAGWRVWVQPDELHAAAAALSAAAGGHLLAAVQAAVAAVLAGLQALQDQQERTAQPAASRHAAAEATRLTAPRSELVACILPQHQQSGRPWSESRAANTEPAVAQPGSSMRSSTTRTSKQQLLQLATSGLAVGRKRRRDEDSCRPLLADEAPPCSSRPPLPAQQSKQQPPPPPKRAAPSGPRGSLLAGLLVRAARSAHNYLVKGGR